MLYAGFQHREAIMTFGKKTPEWTEWGHARKLQPTWRKANPHSYRQVVIDSVLVRPKLDKSA